jgi:DNA-binding MarR family transcriptional regulator
LSHAEFVTPEAALLRVLIRGEGDSAEIMRKIKDWTQGRINLDQPAFAAAACALEGSGLILRRQGALDRRTGEAQAMFALTPAGHASAVEILAASLSRKP